MALPALVRLPGFDAPSAESNEWYTPSDVLDVAREALGGEFDLDPASCDVAQRRVRSERWFTTNDDGLDMPWVADRLWLNPPYSRGGPWVEKLCDGWSTGEVGAGIALILADALVSASGHRIVQQADILCLPPSRFQFIAGPTMRESSPRFGTVLLAGGPRLDVDRAGRALSRLGTVLAPQSFTWDTGYTSWKSPQHPEAV